MTPNTEKAMDNIKNAVKINYLMMKTAWTWKKKQKKKKKRMMMKTLSTVRRKSPFHHQTKGSSVSLWESDLSA